MVRNWLSPSQVGSTAVHWLSTLTLGLSASRTVRTESEAISRLTMVDYQDEQQSNEHSVPFPRLGDSDGLRTTLKWALREETDTRAQQSGCQVSLHMGASRWIGGRVTGLRAFRKTCGRDKGQSPGLLTFVLSITLNDLANPWIKCWKPTF